MSDRGKQSKEKTLMGGVLVLLPAALFTKVIGLFYKIPLIYVVGVEGMAYFLAAYHIYSFLFVISSTGLPTALSLAVASRLADGEGHRGVRRVFFVALWLFLSLGLGGMLLLWCFAEPLAARLSMSGAASGIVAIAPSLLLASFSGAVRGYFQGHHRMVPTAVSEVLEAAGKLLFGLLFALLAKKRGLAVPSVAAAAILGITAGMALSALYLLISLLLFSRKQRRAALRRPLSLPKRGAVLGALCRTAFPITVSASVMSLVGLIDTALIPGCLQRAGFAEGVVNAMYSSYGNLAVPLYNLVPSLLSPITLALTPLMGAAATRRDRAASVACFRTALRTVALVAIPASLGLSTFARPILQLIYAGQAEAVLMAAPLLSLLSLSVLPAALVTLLGAALQAMGRTAVPVWAMLSGAAVKLLLEWGLLRVPTVHMMAAPISTLACHLTVLLVEGVALAGVMRGRAFFVGDLFRPLLAAIPSVAVGLGIYVGCGRAAVAFLPRVLLSLLSVVVLYLLLALRLRAVEYGDFEELPGGVALRGWLERLRLLKGPSQDAAARGGYYYEYGRKKEADFE